jgi:hypothetical protein
MTLRGGDIEMDMDVEPDYPASSDYEDAHSDEGV